ncbi:hypothetical protein S40288_00990 [Stachybotrys chartarum IBT 40288]|nr:hypothetical protein S40288_00990 [Stachybotrys chartarum IBT 40288]
MSSAGLLKLTTAVRKFWVDDAAGPGPCFSTVFDLIGFRVACEPTWPEILEHLGPVYPDRGDLVKSVTSTVTAWCDALASLLDIDGVGAPSAAGEVWIQALVDGIESGPQPHKLRLFVGNSGSPFTAWDSARHGFIISVPNSRSSPAPSTIFRKRLLLAFGADKSPSKIESFGTINSTNAASGAGTSRKARDASELPPAYVPSVNTANTTSSAMPDANTLACPDELFTQPPYTLLMTYVFAGPAKETRIHCSHSPTLEFLHAYLHKWGQTSPEKRSGPEMKLHQSNLRTTTAYDKLVIYGEGFFGSTTTSPTLLISLIEGALGYELVFRGADQSYHVLHYKREKPFLKS